jgi:hypothetical protein
MRYVILAVLASGCASLTSREAHWVTDLSSPQVATSRTQSSRGKPGVTLEATCGPGPNGQKILLLSVSPADPVAAGVEQLAKLRHAEMAVSFDDEGLLVIPAAAVAADPPSLFVAEDAAFILMKRAAASRLFAVAWTDRATGTLVSTAFDVSGSAKWLGPVVAACGADLGAGSYRPARPTML